MQIIVGSKNPIKILAVEELLRDYEVLKGLPVKGVDVPSGVSEQPLTLQETTEGAYNRAKGVVENPETQIGIGIESGLIDVPHSLSGKLDVTVCVIVYKGKSFVGLSSGWEFPNVEISKAMIEGGLDMSQAVCKYGLTDDPNIGKDIGAIGIVTKGRVTRKEYTQEAVRNAFVHLEYVMESERG